MLDRPYDPVFNDSFVANMGCAFQVVSPELPNDQKDCLEAHLEFSSGLKEMYHRSEAMANGLVSWKKKPRGIKNQLVRHIIFCFRRFSRNEAIRSSLEGLMFEQLPILDTPHEKHFFLNGVDTPLRMTHVYFSRQFWEFETYEHAKDIRFDKCDDLTEGDIMIVLSHINNIEFLMWKIKIFYDKHASHKWKVKLDAHVRSVMRSYKPLKSILLSILQHDFIESGA